MISILIPVYNQDVTSLVARLDAQCQRLGMDYEIRCYDDGSQEGYLQANAAIAELDNLSYKALPTNLGRAAIRNTLAADAVYDRLLFLDGDSGVIREDFVARYLSHSEPVVSGGRSYAERPSQEAILHWKYGKQRESRDLAQRRAHPWRYFHTNNFVVDRDLFLSIRFDESIDGYGYEDLVFARELNQRDLTPIHIDNPIMHLELESTDRFLLKTREAVKNLVRLNDAGLFLDTRLEAYGKMMGKLGIKGLYRRFYGLVRRRVESSLNSATPSLRALDLYKLDLFLAQKKS